MGHHSPVPGEGQTETPRSRCLRSSNRSLCQDFSNVTSSSPHFSLISSSLLGGRSLQGSKHTSLPLGAAARLQKSASRHQSPAPGGGPSTASCIQRRKRCQERPCRSCSCNNPFPVAQGNQGSYSLHSIFTREGADPRSRSEPVIFPFDLWPGGLGVSSRCLAAREERSGHCGCAEGVQQFGRSL